MTRPARLGILGAGFWAATFYLPFLRDQPDAEVVGVVRPEAAELAALREAFALELATPDPAELLAADLDGVIVASSHRLHREHAGLALAAGKHVLVEKPMTLRHADALALVAAAHDGATLTVAHGYNYLPMAAWAADAVARGAVGRVRHVTSLMGSSLTELFGGTGGYGGVDVAGHTFAASPETWARADAGGGYLYGQTSHQLGLVLAVHPAEPVLVSARLGRLPNGCDIDVSLSVEFDDGSLGTFSGNGRLPWGVRGLMSLLVEGEQGVLLLDFAQERAELYVDDGDRSPPTASGGVAFAGRAPTERLDVPPGGGLYGCEGPARLLVDRCLGRDAVDRAPAELGARAVAVMEAAGRSAREGRAVAVAELA